ncbi:branched-chain amino acid ABC transporter substrate-binding protein [Lacibacterium aquatile]|uniref:Branched-chain amino acid ABC transporter substrate-binding protein n=1 Tax=Lacibacterium aquatile TaxID=1168082 RepID=A0ABW5DSE6_9PROT
MKKFAFGAAVALAVSVSSGVALAQDIAIGVAGPFTGPNAAFGEQLKRGAQMAIDDLNAKGGLLGKKLKIELGDDASDPRQGVSVANQLATKKVPFVLGHFNSSVSIPASEVYAEEGILQITPASTNPVLTDRGAKFSNVFRVCGRDDQQGTVAGGYIADKFKGKPVAVIHDKTTYGKGLADETKKALNGKGVTEAIYEGVTVGDKDFSALVSKMKAANVEVVYFGGLHNEAGLLVRQMRDQGMKAQFMSGDGIDTVEYWSITGPAGEGTIYTQAGDARKYPTAKAVVDKFRAANYDPEGYTLLSYAGVEVWAKAAEIAKSTKAEDVAKALRGNTFQTVIGELSFDAKGDLKASKYTWWKFSNGKNDEIGG